VPRDISQPFRDNQAAPLITTTILPPPLVKVLRKMSRSPWPNGAKAAISITVDNLGEAQELSSGTWPSGRPIGQHFSVTEALPRMLQIFDECDTKVTFFFETWSVGIYPDVAKEVVRRGHEIGWHGFQHEMWTKLSLEEEEENFSKSFADAKRFGIKYDGFRPPGGLINDGTYRLLREHGIRYISPVAEKAAITRDLAVLPFHWKTIDAYYYMEEFSGLRRLYGAEEKALDPQILKKCFFDQVEEAVKSGAYISFLFHPILQTSEDKFSVIQEVVEHIAKDPRIWCAPCTHIADWVLKHPDSFNSDPAWIKDTW
jgi:peptidoglycan/xylan/chitin deacetylase (PgdA/CDA1 family)